jgi:hypothetical protein
MKTSAVIRSVAVMDLRVDASYQRPLDEADVRSIVRRFDADSLGAIQVGERPDGSLWIADGQHRVAALLALGVSETPAVVFRSSGPCHEARVFKLYNSGRRAVRPIQLHLAGIAAGDAREVAIAGILSRYGLRAADAAGWPSVQAIGKCQRIFGWDGGPAILDRALSVIVRAWEGEPSALTQFAIGGVALAIKRAPDIDDRRLVSKLARVSFEAVLRSSDAFYRGVGLPGGNARESAVAIVIHNLYAKGLRKPNR